MSIIPRPEEFDKIAEEEDAKELTQWLLDNRRALLSGKTCTIINMGCYMKLLTSSGWGTCYAHDKKEIRVFMRKV